MNDTKTKDETPPRRAPLGALRRWFFAGLIVSAPILLTGYITWLLVKTIDGYMAGILPANLNPQTHVDFYIPGFGLAAAVLIIVIIGALTTGFLGRWIIRLSENLVNRLPVVRSLYGAIKQIMETITASQSDAFREVVLVEYPRRGTWVIGFVTGTTKGEVQKTTSTTLINVFVPTTPNPTSGFLLFIPRADAIKLDMSVEEALKMIVSGGIITPDDKADKIAVKEKAVKKPAKKTGKKSAKKAVKKTAKKSAKKTGKKSAKKSAKKA